MPKLLTLTLVTAALLLPLSSYAQNYSDDPGLRDTVRLSGGPLVVGQSRPVDIFVCNDTPINLMVIVLAYSSVTGGIATFDSVTYCGRMSDPSVLRWRSLAGERNGVLPDTVLLLNLEMNGNEIGPGAGVEMKLYFTGVAPGSIMFDSCSNSVGTGLAFVVQTGSDFIMYRPYFESVTIPVIIDSRPPELSVTPSDRIGTVGSSIQLEASAQGFVGGNTTVSLVSFTAEDNDATLPSSAPSVIGTNPLTLSWSPAAADIGIWNVTFRAEDSSGQQTTASARVQVVADNRFMLSFSTVATDNKSVSSAMVTGDLDNDNAPELFVTAIPVVERLGLLAWDITADGRCVNTFSPDKGHYCYGPQLGYFDGDNNLDAISVETFNLMVLHGTGDGGFQSFDSLEMYTGSWTSATLTDFNGDAYLDYAVAYRDSLTVFAADQNSRFHPVKTVGLSSHSRSINSADFNNDGWEDLAIGTVAGLDIYLNSHGTGYVKAHAYTQQYGTVDIQVTNQGSDFNNDNIFDLCLATPSVGGVNSELMVYLGRGDGSFEQRIVRTVKGQIFATAAGDFNGDNELDIAFINGSRPYVAILFGDGYGNFLNEIRLPVPKYSPGNMACLDYDLDNDLDLVVSSNRTDKGSVLLLYKNDLNLSAMASTSLEILAEDNAKTELVAPGGAVVNAVRQSLSSGAFHRRNLNDNSNIDQVVRCAANESGAYRVNLTPRENLPVGSKFSLRYKVDGKSYRIAKNVAMPATGYSFSLYPNGLSPITPVLGAFITVTRPVFRWTGEGPFRFELAADPNFSTLIASATVAEERYTLETPLPDADSAIYYWRVRPTSSNTWNGFYSFNVASSPTDVEPPEDSPLPRTFALGQNYPNPFNPGTTISYDLPRRVQVRLEVFNVLGQKVATLVNGLQEAGHQFASWNGKDQHGTEASSGIYFYRLTAGEFSATAKMVLLK